MILVGILRIAHQCRAESGRMRMVFAARPAGVTLLRTEPNDYSLGAAWFSTEEMNDLPLRSPEVVALAHSVMRGEPIYPLSLLQVTSAACVYPQQGSGT